MATKNCDLGERRRFESSADGIDEIRFPPVSKCRVSQDAEWCEIVKDGKPKRIRFHDYDEIYSVPRLYEEIFYELLECSSPERVVSLLRTVVAEFGEDPKDLRVLDVGAGNGIVGEELAEMGATPAVGIDIIPEAKEAAQRDRPELYDDYMVVDLTDVSEQQEHRLRDHKANCLTTVAALGFGDIPPKAFLQALDVIETPGWVAFNIKEDFLFDDDQSGFSQLIETLWREKFLQVHVYRRYRHRLSIAGDPLHYVAIIARKLEDVPDRIVEAFTKD